LLQHQPVLLKEVIEGLNIVPDGIYVDATFGRGGHSKAILQCLGSTGKLIVIDKDLEAIFAAKAIQDGRLQIIHGSFAKLNELNANLAISGRVQGVLLDLGVSSPQLDEAARGFSFLKEGPLDMRMDVSQTLTAAKWVNSAKEAEIVEVLKEYGEERFSRRIAHAIVVERSKDPILTTMRLAKIVADAHPAWEKHKHPATRVFQAIRIFVNNELEEITSCLEQCLEILSVTGRLLVITFHSLEDKIVKEFIRKNNIGGMMPNKLPLMQEQLRGRIKRLGKAIRPSAEEIALNPRARSATLYILEKTG
jgi:16S rRNA (cytosine1402-N4)-methyltransferase